MMFSVYGYVMMIGAIVGESEAVFGNFMMGAICTVLMLILLQVGLRGQKKAHQRFNSIISTELESYGHVDAERFATTANISLDDARDILAKIAEKRNWACAELGGYNAHYTPR